MQVMCSILHNTFKSNLNLSRVRYGIAIYKQYLVSQASLVSFLPRVLLYLNLEKFKTVDSHSRFYINSEMRITCSTNNIPSIKCLICLAVMRKYKIWYF